MISQWRGHALAGDRSTTTDGLGMWTPRDENRETGWTVMRYRAGATGLNDHLPEPGGREAREQPTFGSGSPGRGRQTRAPCLEIYIFRKGGNTEREHSLEG